MLSGDLCRDNVRCYECGIPGGGFSGGGEEEWREKDAGGEGEDRYSCWDHVPDQLVLVCLDWL